MTKKVFSIFLLALVLRFSVIFIAHHGDLNNNISWGTLAVERGLNGFYDPPTPGFGEVKWPYSAPNQPPLTILLFWMTRLSWQGTENFSWWLNNNFPLFPSSFIWFWENKGMDLMVKLPSIFADLGIAWLIFNYFNRLKRGLILASVWLFNPITWYNSSVWGQTDSIVNFLGLAGILFLLKKNLPAFATLFTLCLLFKGSLLMFIPVLFFIALWQKYSVRDWLHAIGHVLFWTIIVSIWFHPSIGIIPWLVNLYNQRILPGEIGYLTANAFNFWWLVDPGKTLDSTIYLGLPARVWGFVILLIGMILLIRWLREKFSNKNIFFSLSLISLVSFLFMTRIHERYLYPFFPSGTILIGFDPLLALPYTILSVTHLLNLYNLFWIPSFPVLESLMKAEAIPIIISFLNIVISSIFVILGLRIKKQV